MVYFDCKDTDQPEEYEITNFREDLKEWFHENLRQIEKDRMVDTALTNIAALKNSGTYIYRKIL